MGRSSEVAALRSWAARWWAVAVLVVVVVVGRTVVVVVVGRIVVRGRGRTDGRRRRDRRSRSNGRGRSDRGGRLDGRGRLHGEDVRAERARREGRDRLRLGLTYRPRGAPSGFGRLRRLGAVVNRGRWFGRERLHVVSAHLGVVEGGGGRVVAGVGRISQVRDRVRTRRIRRTGWSTRFSCASVVVWIRCRRARCLPCQSTRSTARVRRT